MKNKLSWAVCGVVAALLGAATAGIVRPPAKAFEVASHDFGPVASDVTPLHTFVFANHHDFNIRIFSVSASCGCIKTAYEQNWVLPGEGGRLVVGVDLGGKLVGESFAGELLVQFEPIEAGTQRIEVVAARGTELAAE